MAGHSFGLFTRAHRAPRRHLGALLALMCTLGVLPAVLGPSSPAAAAIIGSSPSAVGDLYTIAGTGSAGDGASGAQATSAALNGDSAVTSDGSGNVYLVDNNNNVVREVAGTNHTQWGIKMTAGDLYTIAGNGTSGYSGNGGPATGAELSGPAGIAIDHAGNLVIGDSGNGAVRLIAATSCSSRCPYGLSSMVAGDIYTIAGGNGWGGSGLGGPASAAQMYSPDGVALDGNGDVFIADQAGNRILMLAASSCTASCPYGLSSTTADDLYGVAGSGYDAGSWTGNFSGAGGPALSADLNQPRAVEVSSSGDLVIGNTSDDVIEVVPSLSCTSSCPYGLSAMTADDIYVIAGSPGSGNPDEYQAWGSFGASVRLRYPAGLALDSAGDVLFSASPDNVVGFLAAKSCAADCPYGIAPTSAGHLYDLAGDGYGAGGSGGTGGTAGAGGPAPAAELNDPYGVATDAAGDVFIADEAGDRVLEVVASPSPLYAATPGDLVAVAGTGAPGTSQDGDQSTVSQLVSPSGVAADGKGNLYIADGNRVQEVASYEESRQGRLLGSGNSYTVAGSSANASGDCANGASPTGACLASVGGVAVDARGDLYIADSANNRVVEIPASSGTQWGDVQMTAGELYTIAGSASGTAGDCANGAALRPCLADPTGLALDASGDLHIADSGNNRVVELAAVTGSQKGMSMTEGDLYTVVGQADGQSGRSGDGTYATNAYLDDPTGVALDANGDLYVADRGNNEVDEVANSPGTQWGIDMSPGGLYVLGGSPDGTPGSAGDGGAPSDSYLSAPSSVVVDSSGNLYVADAGNARVQLFTVPTISCTGTCPWGMDLQPNTTYTLAGSASNPGSAGYGGPASATRLQDPVGIALDASGDLYVADKGNALVDEVVSYDAKVTGSGTGAGLPKEALGGSNPSELGPRQPKIASNVQSTGLSVNPATGEADVSVDDLSLPGRGLSLDLTRSYSSADASNLGAFGYGWVDSYDLYLAYDPKLGPDVVGVHQENGSVVYFMESPAGPQAPWITSPRVHASLEQLANGTWHFTRDAQVTYLFSATKDSAGNYPLASENDLNGYTTTLSYNGSGQLATVTDPEGRTFAFTYNASGLVATLADSAGQQTRYTYDASKDLQSVTDVGGGVSTYGWDGNHRLTSLESPLSQTTNLAYFSSGANAGLVSSVTDPMGRATSYAYALTNRTTSPSGTVTVTSPRISNGAHVQEQYSYGDGQLIGVTDAYGTDEAAQTSYAYFPGSDGTKSVTDPDGHATAYTYDANGNLLSETNPLGAVTDHTYNAFDEVLTTQSPLQLAAGVEVSHTYDANGNLTSTSVPNPTSPSAPYVTTYHYGTGCSTGGANGCYLGDVASVTDANANTTSYTYDADGNATSVTDALGNTTSYAYNALGEMTSKSAPPGNAPSPGTAGVIETIAGSGAQGTGATGGPATSAGLDTPSDAIFDTAGDEIVVDQKNNEVDLLAARSCAMNCPFGLSSMTSGDLYVIAGNGIAGFSGIPGPARSTELNGPDGVAFDHEGNLLVSVANSAAVVVLAATSCSSRCPYGLSATTAGDLYLVAGVGSSTPWSGADGGEGGPATQAYLNYPNGVGVAQNGDLLIANSSDNAIDLVPARSCSGTCPYGMAEATGGDLYRIVGSPGSSNPEVDEGWGDAGSAVKITWPAGLSVDAAGNVLFTSSADDVAGFLAAGGCSSGCAYGATSTSAGSIYQIAGVGTAGSSGDGGPASEAELSSPAGISADPAGDVLVADAGNNRVREVESGAGVAETTTTTYGYDAYGDLTSETNPLGEQTTATYDKAGDLLTETTPKGEVTKNAYDQDGELTSTTAAYGTSLAATTSYCYDTAGDKTASVPPDGNTSGIAACSTSAPYDTSSPYQTTYAYDALGNLTSTTDALGHVTSTTYDPAGNTVSSTDANGSVTSDVYDAANELVAQTDGAGSAAQQTLVYTYDLDGNKTSYIDGAGDLTSYAYNIDDEVTSSTNPLGETTSYAYDADGSETSLTNPSGQVTTWTYNGDNQPSTISFSGGTPGVALTYAPSGAVATMTDGTSTSAYVSDNAGQLRSYTDGAGANVRYGYDADGNVAAITYPNAKTVAQAYDALGQLTSVSDWLGNTTSFTHDASSNLTSIAYPNGITSTNTFDTANRLTGISDTLGSNTVASFSYSLDPASLLTSETDTGTPAPGTKSYAYNALHELTSAGSDSYTYNAANDLTKGPSGQIQAFNAADELCWSGASTGTCAAPPSGAASYTYSEQGNLTTVTPSSGPSASYSWNQANELTGATPASGSSASYRYDGNGLLQSEAITGTATTSFTWNVQGSLPLLLEDGTNAYVYGPGATPIEQINLLSGTPSYPLSDRLGSVRAVSDSTGTITGSCTYGAWGNVTATSGTMTTPFGFAGGYHDVATGLYYFRARWYDSTTGQWMSIDPDIQLTTEAYSYTGNDPANNTDPSGQAAEAQSCGTVFATLSPIDGGRRSYVRFGFEDLCFSAFSVSYSLVVFPRAIAPPKVYSGQAIFFPSTRWIGEGSIPLSFPPSHVSISVTMTNILKTASGYAQGTPRQRRRTIRGPANPGSSGGTELAAANAPVPKTVAASTTAQTQAAITRFNSGVPLIEQVSPAPGQSVSYDSNTHTSSGVAMSPSGSEMIGMGSLTSAQDDAIAAYNAATLGINTVGADGTVYYGAA